jgi:hypothetical protein
MLKKSVIQIILRVFLCGLLIALFSSTVFSESVFLKNGSIVEGTVTAENDTMITLESPSGEKNIIQRSNILRILVHKRYRDRIYLTRIDGYTYEGFIVNEDNSRITLRTSLGSPEEISVTREAVETISRRKPSEKIVPSVRYSSVFMKDGEIIDCRILKEAGRYIEVSPLDGERRVIQKADILRTQYNNSYKDKKIFSKRDGTRIEGYIMEENDREYIFRRELFSPEEERVLKNDLTGISAG